MLEKILETEKLANKLLAEFGLLELGWKFKFDNSKHRIGQCRYEEKEIGYSSYFLEKTSWEEIEDTIRHEIAHALSPPTRIRGRWQSHGYDWKLKAIEVGCKPTACSDEAVSSAKPNFYIECDNCKRRYPRYRLKKAALARSLSSCCHAKLNLYKVVKEDS